MPRGYQWLSPAEVDAIWVRLRAGNAAKPTARGLGLPTSTVRAYLLRCGGIRPDPRRRSPARLSFAEREEISRGLAAGASLRAIAVGLGRAPSTVSREVATHGSSPVSCRHRRPAGVGAGDASQAVQAGHEPGPCQRRGPEAEETVVPAADRGMA